MLKRLGIVIDREGKAAKLFKDLASDFMDVEYKNPSDYVRLLWKRYEKYPEKIKDGDVIGLDKVIIATEPEFDILIKELKSYKCSEPPTFKVIESRQIINKERVKNVF